MLFPNTEEFRIFFYIFEFCR